MTRLHNWSISENTKQDIPSPDQALLLGHAQQSVGKDEIAKSILRGARAREPSQRAASETDVRLSSLRTGLMTISSFGSLGYDDQDQRFFEELAAFWLLEGFFLASQETHKENHR